MVKYIYHYLLSVFPFIYIYSNNILDIYNLVSIVLILSILSMGATYFFYNILNKLLIMNKKHH
jgi:hypothetical protein